jgi:transposase
MKSKLIDITGEVFGPMTVLRRDDNKGPNNRNSYWIVRCDCGHPLCRKVFSVSSAHLRSGHTQSCGSKRTEKFALKHGHASRPTPIYRAWLGMRNRCNNSRSNSYKDWGGRGITICERWNSFENFLADTGPTWFPGAENDRIDPMGNYCPENHQWIEKGTGRRRTSILVSWNGKTMLVTAACKEAGVSRAAVLYWMRHHKNRSFEEAVAQLKKNEEGDGLRANSIRVSLNGEILSLHKAARILDMSYPNLHRLMHRRGFSFEKAVDHLRNRKNDKQKYPF